VRAVLVRRAIFIGGIAIGAGAKGCAVRAYRSRSRRGWLPIGLSLAVVAGVGIGQLPVRQRPAAAAGPEAAAAQQVRQDQCLLSNVLRIGGPAMKRVAVAGLGGDAAALHAAANPSYWTGTPLDTAYQTDHQAESAKLGQLQTFHQNLGKVNGTMSLSALRTPGVIPNGPEDPWKTVVPSLRDPFSDIGFGSWVAQNFWTSESTFYTDPVPLAAKSSVDALTALGNSRYQEPAGTDPNFQQELREWQAWRDMSFMHGYYADDTGSCWRTAASRGPPRSPARSSSGSRPSRSRRASRVARSRTRSTRTRCWGPRR
jgi:hypothetical protein